MEINREEIKKLEAQEEYIRRLKIEDFRKLTKEDKEKLLSNIKSGDEIGLLHSLAYWNKDNVECQEHGHDFTDWIPVEYDDWQEWYTKDFDPEIGTDDGVFFRHNVEYARLCQRCAKLELKSRTK